MRTIKFRAWDSENKKMFFYPKWATLHSKVVLYFSKSNDSYVDESDNDISVELMQFTGLLDKNGKEIYEGDIVHWMSGKYPDIQAFSVVEFINEPLVLSREDDEYQIVGFALSEIKGRFTPRTKISLNGENGSDIVVDTSIAPIEQEGDFWELFYPVNDKDWEYEVLGNIYENPQLLNQ